jgi:pantoate--beta-alanine ligase
MERVHLSAELRARLDKARVEGLSVGMVGTSGALHQGHLSLIRRAAEENDVAVLFWGGNSASDWMESEIGYERDAGRDFALAEEVGLDVIFAPDNAELFPREPMTRVSLPGMSSAVPHLEDPAHLDLVAVSMARLWNIFGPCRCYFGEKDWQQLALFQRLADDLAYPVEVLGCATVREDDGVAISSRNSQLTAEERAQAPVLYRALSAAHDAALDGVRSSDELTRVFAEVIGDHAEIRYFTPVESTTMVPLDELGGSVRLLASIGLGSVRLVDNLGVELPA